MRLLHRLTTLPLLAVALLAANVALAQQEAATGSGAVAPPAAERTPDEAQEPAAEEPTPDPGSVAVAWSDGFRLSTADGRFELGIGGRLHFDSNYLSDSEPFDGRLGTVESGFEVRRARIHLRGHVYDRVEYMLELDFAGGEVGARDMYVGVRDLPVTARFGHMKEPFSLEELTSSRFITFMERSIANMFAPSRNTGISVGSDFADGKGTWEAGVFRDTDGFSPRNGDNYNLTGRITYAPLFEDAGKRLVHGGAGFQNRWIDGTLSLSTRPGDHNTPGIIRVSIPATAAQFLSLEAAAGFGPFGLQGEYDSVWVSSAERGDPHLSGYYVQGHWFVTGEHRPYRGGKFDRVRPAANFLDGGAGAWQVAARWGRVDVTEGLAEPPGVLTVLTLGLNWYWNPNVRWSMNYELADLPQVDTDKVSILHWRLGIDF